MASLVATVKQGRLRGLEGESIKGHKFVKFLGIPYAKPPIGDLRFKAPQPADPWTGERDATKVGNACLAVDSMIQGNQTASEDCLNLNVFTRNISPNGNLKPVMVFIHGGAFTMGSNNPTFCGPEVLIQKDVVLVTINYRLGIFGFLSLEDTSLEVPGNAGMKDMVLALRWVQENIVNFGGDAKNVTIFGISAGGAAVHYLLLSKSAKNLFHRAIAMSGSALNPWARGSKNVTEVSKILGKETTSEKEALAVLMKASGEELVQAQMKLTDYLWDASTTRPFCPVVEYPNPTAFLQNDPKDIIATGQYNQVPFMTGFASREGKLLAWFKEQITSVVDLAKTSIPQDLTFEKNGKVSEWASKKIREKYLNAEEGTIDLFSDLLFTNGILESVEKQVKTSTFPIYLYQISHQSKVGWMKNMFKDKLLELPGVSHADDTPYFFHSTIFSRDVEEGSPEEKTSDRLIALWTNFATYGQPTPLKSELGIDWIPVQDPANLIYMDVNEELSLKVAPFAERVAFWKELYLNKDTVV